MPHLYETSLDWNQQQANYIKHIKSVITSCYAAVQSLILFSAKNVLPVMLEDVILALQMKT